VVNAAAIEEGEEVAQLAVEGEQLQAHLLPFGPISMADVIRGRQADRENVGAGAAAELQLVDQSGGNGERVAVEFRRGSQSRSVAGTTGERAAADGLAGP